MKNLIKKILREEVYWYEGPDKWDLLEKDLRTVIDGIIEKHKSRWDDDQYAVIGAIEEIFEGMFSKVER